MTFRDFGCPGGKLVWDVPTGQVMQVYPADFAIVTDTGSANLPLPSPVTHLWAMSSRLFS